MQLINLKYCCSIFDYNNQVYYKISKEKCQKFELTGSNIENDTFFSDNKVKTFFHKSIFQNLTFHKKVY